MTPTAGRRVRMVAFVVAEAMFVHHPKPRTQQAARKHLAKRVRTLLTFMLGRAPTVDEMFEVTAGIEDL